MSGLWIAAYCQSVIRAQLRHDLIRLTVAGGEVLRPRQVSQLSTYPTCVRSPTLTLMFLST